MKGPGQPRKDAEWSSARDAGAAAFDPRALDAVSVALGIWEVVP